MVAPIFGGMIWDVLVGLFALCVAAWPVVSRWLREAALVSVYVLALAVALVAWGVEAFGRWRSERRRARELAEIEDRRRR